MWLLHNVLLHDYISNNKQVYGNNSMPIVQGVQSLYLNERIKSSCHYNL